MTQEHPIDDAVWMAYVDGGLDAAGRARVEAAMSADPALAARVAAQQQLRSRLQRGLADELQEPVPDRLSALLAAAPAPLAATAAGPVLAAPPGGGPARAWLLLGAGLIAGQLLPRLLPEQGADLRIDGRLAQALERQLSADTATPEGWQLRLSFRSQDGRYCRAFSGTQQAGLACKPAAGGPWQLAMLVPAAASQGELRQASAALPAVLLQAVDAQLQGETLDAAAEARAREAGWR